MGFYKRGGTGGGKHGGQLLIHERIGACHERMERPPTHEWVEGPGVHQAGQEMRGASGLHW